MKKNGLVLLQKHSEVDRKVVAIEKELRAKQATYEANRQALELDTTSDQPNHCVLPIISF